MSLALAGTVWVAHHLESDPTLREVALFAHLASLVVGFGAVLTIDWVGLLWALRLRTLNEVLDTARNVQVPIWVGLMGLVLSGTLAAPKLKRSFRWCSPTGRGRDGFHERGSLVSSQGLTVIGGEVTRNGLTRTRCWP